MAWCVCSVAVLACGVLTAPLGYGATTLPALTEAFTIDHNSTLAKLEVKRLQKLIDNLADEIEP